MAARQVRGLTPAELVVEASLQDVPAKGPVFELATSPAGRLCKALDRLHIRLTAEELEQQLVDAGFSRHGSSVGRRRLQSAAVGLIAKELSAALRAGQPVFWAHSEAGPSLNRQGSLQLDALPGLGLGAPGSLLNVGPLESLPGLVSAALLAWARGPGRRVKSDKLWLVTGGLRDPDPGKTWHASLQRLADDSAKVVSVRHLPACILRWVRPRVLVAQVQSILPDGRTLNTVVERVYLRRPSRPSPPVHIQVRDAVPVLGRPVVKTEGKPALRRYRVTPR